MSVVWEERSTNGMCERVAAVVGCSHKDVEYAERIQSTGVHVIQIKGEWWMDVDTDSDDWRPQPCPDSVTTLDEAKALAVALWRMA